MIRRILTADTTHVIHAIAALVDLDLIARDDLIRAAVAILANPDFGGADDRHGVRLTWCGAGYPFLIYRPQLHACGTA